MKKRNITEL